MEFGYNATLFEREMRSAIEKRRDEFAIQVVSGAGVTDFADYRRLTAYVAAFEEALQLMDEVRARLMKPQD